jgi:hypothetical protein
LRYDFEHVRDFIILHYKLTQRDDTPFRRSCGALDIPDSLKGNIARAVAGMPAHQDFLASYCSPVKS